MTSPKPLQVWQSSAVVLDDRGLHLDGSHQGEEGHSLPWAEIRRIAWFIRWSVLATGETVYFAIQTASPDQTWWIDISAKARADRVLKGLEQRLGRLEFPAMAEMTPDTQGGDWGFVLWPPEHRGQPLYAGLSVRRWWFFSCEYFVYASGLPERDKPGTDS